MQKEIVADTVIRHIYEASYTSEHWPIALEFITRYIGSKYAALFHTDNEVEDLSYSYTYNIPKDIVTRCNGCGTTPSCNILADNVPVGTAAAIDHIIPDRKELENLFGDEFNAFLKEADMHYLAGSILFKDDACSSGICLQRPKSMGPWTKNQIDKLNTLVPHLQHAVTIQTKFAKLQMREQAFCGGLDRLLMGLILFDKKLKPIYTNPVAKSILKHHSAVSLKRGRIITCEHAQNDKIYSALNFAISSKTDRASAESSTSMGLRHPDYATVLPVVISPVHGALNGFEIGGHHAYAAIFFSDPNISHPLEADQLADAYKLTPAESQVAISIANGINPDQIAKINNVAISTIRSQLKSIYQKIGINSQIELVKVLLTGPFGTNI